MLSNGEIYTAYITAANQTLRPQDERIALAFAREIETAVLKAQAGEPAKHDREADRVRFPDLAFNQWLDEGISDAGHTVWDQISNICDAWHGWINSALYTEPVKAQEGEHIRRWNIEPDGDDLLICDGNHDKHEKCEYIRYTPASTVKAQAGEPYSDGMTAEDDKQFNRQWDVKPLTPQWDVDADWLYSVLRYADKNPDTFPEVAEGKITLEGSDAQIIIDALNNTHPTTERRVFEWQGERKIAEHEYITTAFNYPEAPIGSRDWTLFWQGWQAALNAVPAKGEV